MEDFWQKNEKKLIEFNSKLKSDSIAIKVLGKVLTTVYKRVNTDQAFYYKMFISRTVISNILCCESILK